MPPSRRQWRRFSSWKRRSKKLKMQRYFLIFFNHIFKLFIINKFANSPVQKSLSNNILTDSEYSQTIETDDFVSRDDIVGEETFLTAKTCRK